MTDLKLLSGLPILNAHACTRGLKHSWASQQGPPEQAQCWNRQMSVPAESDPIAARTAEWIHAVICRTMTSLNKCSLHLTGPGLGSGALKYALGLIVDLVIVRPAARPLPAATNKFQDREISTVPQA